MTFARRFQAPCHYSYFSDLHQLTEYIIVPGGYTPQMCCHFLSPAKFSNVGNTRALILCKSSYVGMKCTFEILFCIRDQKYLCCVKDTIANCSIVLLINYILFVIPYHWNHPNVYPEFLSLDIYLTISGVFYNAKHTKLFEQKIHSRAIIKNSLCVTLYRYVCHILFN